MTMKYIYDKETDSLAIVFAEGRRYDTSEEIFDGVNIDYDTSGKPVAIEFHDRASRFVDTDGLASGREVQVSNPDLSSISEIDGPGLRAFRVAIGMTQSDLAQQLSVGANTIARWERGELRIENPRMLRLALERLASHNSTTHDAATPAELMMELLSPRTTQGSRSPRRDSTSGRLREGRTSRGSAKSAAAKKR
jgi:transcriptional regulator with XRE-family HTH domain/uncharacterized protein YuzE